MCVLCGYISKSDNVAPKLLALGEKIEGLWSGFYTGVGALGDDGIIRHHKTTGCSSHWRERFTTDDLSGRTGFFHSRTNSGGDARYAHPFVSCDGTTMLVGQGHAGCFAKHNDKIVDIANSLLDEGVVFSSADYELERKKYQVLKDGSQVHVSDIVTEYAASLYRKLGDPLEAVRQTATDILEEAISLFIFNDKPGHIYVSNMNARLAIRRIPDGVFMSTSLLLFDKVYGEALEMPSNAIADISLETISFKPLIDNMTVGTLDNPKGLYQDVYDFIKSNNGVTLPQIMDTVVKKHCTPDDTAPQFLQGLPHLIIEQMVAEGKVRYETRKVSGLSCCDDLGARTLFMI